MENSNLTIKIQNFQRKFKFFPKMSRKLEIPGVDEKDVARGTWLGMDAHGKVGMLLSITQPVDSKHKNAPSRG